MAAAVLWGRWEIDELEFDELFSAAEETEEGVAEPRGGVEEFESVGGPPDESSNDSCFPEIIIWPVSSSSYILVTSLKRHESF